MQNPPGEEATVRQDDGAAVQNLPSDTVVAVQEEATTVQRLPRDDEVAGQDEAAAGQTPPVDAVVAVQDDAAAVQTPPGQDVMALPRTVFMSRIVKPVETVLQVPAAPKRSKKTLPPNFVLRRTRRVAKLPPHSDHKAAATVCRQLGFNDVENQDGVPPMEMYKWVFDQPLSKNHLKALAALFGWDAPNCGDDQGAGGTSVVC